jgi:hypothetical protein
MDINAGQNIILNFVIDESALSKFQFRFEKSK